MPAKVLLIILLALPALAQAQSGTQPQSIIETGTLNGAAFRIDRPAQWSGGLVMYCHGYLRAGAAPDLNSNALIRETGLAHGFAFAQSAYRAQGWAVKEGIEDTEALRRYFVDRYGQPKETLVMGHSMGGVIALATLERYPDRYDGALPMCGPLSISLQGMQERIFDMLVTFDYLFPNVVGPLTQALTGAPIDPAKAKAALEAAPEKAALFARRFSLALADVPSVLAFHYELNRELQLRSGGNPFDNRNIIYDGFGDDAALNRGVKRYAADAKAFEYLRRYYTPTGRIADPVLTLHTTYDPLVPGRYVNDYDAIARLAGTQDLFVTQFVVAHGHCRFTPAQTTAAFEALLRWVREQKKPQAGEVK